jgi:glycolate oxidase
VTTRTLTLVEALAERLPAECLQTDPDVVSAYSQDRAVFESAGTAAVLVMASSTEEVVATVEVARTMGVPIVPRGAGSGLTGAANAVDGCILLSLLVLAVAGKIAFDLFAMPSELYSVRLEGKW